MWFFYCDMSQCQYFLNEVNPKHLVTKFYQTQLCTTSKWKDLYLVNMGVRKMTIKVSLGRTVVPDKVVICTFPLFIHLQQESIKSMWWLWQFSQTKKRITRISGTADSTVLACYKQGLNQWYQETNQQMNWGKQEKTCLQMKSNLIIILRKEKASNSKLFLFSVKHIKALAVIWSFMATS